MQFNIDLKYDDYIFNQTTLYSKYKSSDDAKMENLNFCKPHHDWQLTRQPAYSCFDLLTTINNSRGFQFDQISLLLYIHILNILHPSFSHFLNILCSINKFSEIRSRVPPRPEKQNLICFYFSLDLLPFASATLTSAQVVLVLRNFKA